MTWVRVESGIRGSAKVRRFAADLKITPAAAIGHLVLLWGQVAEHQCDGDLRNTQDELLEEWALWVGRRGRFAQAYRSAFAPTGLIHDWGEHQGKLVERRMRDRQRKRSGYSAGNAAELPQEIQRNSAGNGAEIPQELRRKSAGNPAELRRKSSGTPQELRRKSSGTPQEILRNSAGNGAEIPALRNDTYTERKEETTQRQHSARAREPWETAWETEVRTLLPEEYHPDLDAVLRGSQRPAALLAELRLALRGEKLGCEGAQPHHVGAALRDCTLSPGPLTGGKLAAFIRGAMSPTVRTAPTAPLDEYEAARRKFAAEEARHAG